MAKTLRKKQKSKKACKHVGVKRQKSIPELNSIYKGKTYQQTRHMENVKKLPCIICSNGFKDNIPGITQLHHVKDDKGRKNHYRTIPLCESHHQRGTGKKIAVHQNKENFEKYYGKEEGLLLTTLKKLDQYALLNSYSKKILQSLS